MAIEPEAPPPRPGARPVEDREKVKDEARARGNGAGPEAPPKRPRGRPPGAERPGAGAGAGAKPEAPPIMPEFTPGQVRDMFGRPIRMALVAFDCDDPKISDDDLDAWAGATTAFFNKYRQYLYVELVALWATATLVGPRVVRRIKKNRDEEERAERERRPAGRGEARTHGGNDEGERGEGAPSGADAARPVGDGGARES